MLPIPAFLAPLADSVPGVPDVLLGPLAALALALFGLILFLRETLVPGARALRAEKAAADAITLAQGAQDAMKQMAAAIEERNKLDQERVRLIQAGLLDERGVIPRRRDDETQR